MKKNIFLWQISGLIFTFLGGVLLHFLYDWTNESILIAPFSGVNESTWEHMKLIYYPMLVYALIQNRFFKESENFWCVKLVGILTGLALIPTLFYTYNGVVGKSPDWINITIFFIATAMAFIVETRLLKNIIKGEPSWCKNPTVAYALICVIGILFVIFTFAPPKIPLFRDPVSGSYGV